MGRWEIMRELRSCSYSSLKELDIELHLLMKEAKERERQSMALSREVMKQSQSEHRTYQQLSIKCGKPGCKCTKGELHGPYWYAYWSEKGRTRSQYLGKNAPEGIEEEQESEE
jgi:hypothetical protein